MQHCSYRTCWRLALYRLSPKVNSCAKRKITQSLREVRAEGEGELPPIIPANVISRAIGAEPGVEVDMKVVEVEDGTEFLLCTDGITRHIPDHELRQLMLVHDDLATLCSELKEKCFERGAEDNLTAVVVRVGRKISNGEARRIWRNYFSERRPCRRFTVRHQR